MTIIQDIKPFFNVARLFGLDPHSISATRPTISKIAILQMIICAHVQGYFLYERLKIVISESFETKTLLLTLLRTVVLYLALYAEAVLSLFRNRKLQELISHLQMYDRITRMEERWMSRAMSWAIIVTVLLYWLTVGIFTYHSETQQQYLTAGIYAILYSALSCGVLKFMVILGSLMLRLRHLNGLLLSDAHMMKTSLDHGAFQLEDIWWLHSCLLDAAEMINSYFSVPLFLWLMAFSLNTISRIYTVLNFSDFSSHSKLLREGCTALASIWILFSITCACHMTSVQANKIGIEVFSPRTVITRKRESLKSNFEVGMYFQLRQFHFSAAAGIIRVDLPLLISIAGAMTTYLVILHASSKK